MENYFKRLSFEIKKLRGNNNRPFLVAFCLLFSFNGISQCLSHQQFWDKIIEIEQSDNTTEQKLKELNFLKVQFENCNLPKDSVYARMLHRMGALEYSSQNFSKALLLTRQALSINKSGIKGASRSYLANNYYNLGLIYFNGFSLFRQALLCFDSSIIIGRNNPSFKRYVAPIQILSADIYFKLGDFEKTIEASTLALATAHEIKDSLITIDIFLERSQAYEMQLKHDNAMQDVDSAFMLLKKNTSAENPEYNSWANAYRYKADIIAARKNCAEAIKLFDVAIEYRKKAGDIAAIATDYNDAGYMLLYTCKNSELAKKYFNTAYKMSIGPNEKKIAALASNNLAQISFEKKDFLTALNQYQQTLNLILPRSSKSDLLQNPSYKEFQELDTKKDAELPMDNKSKCLLYLYKQTNNKKYLDACIKTAMITDSLITDMRHEQTGEKSKLYWRNDTRDFFTRTLEACYLDNNAPLAFYFLEKSRAVLLNDNLGEIGAAAYLPITETQKEGTLRTQITELQQQVSTLDNDASNYKVLYQQLLLAKDNFERYIKSLEKKYPLYYQYKYADQVPALNTLQQWLGEKKQSFIHYFFGDTVSYILAITKTEVKFLRLSQKDFNSSILIEYLQTCSNKEELNHHYQKFVSLSYLLYQKLFEKLQLSFGRVIICADNFLIPFESFCSDESGKSFLIRNYSFSYTYSARFLLNKFPDYKAKGDFLGIAPVSFASYLQLPDLKNSAEALKNSASFYSDSKLLLDEGATSKNFMEAFPNYSIVNIFSHARADTSGTEPMLYMCDTAIKLSQLQLINNPATKLVMLSACQTNMGKNATGEGIYSLARGFAGSGIPAISATLWKADEQTIYEITKTFNENLTKGMNKDEALQQAKITFIQNSSSNEKLLPYYWANMILLGNTEPVRVSESNAVFWWVGFAALSILFISVVVITKRKEKFSKPKENQ